MSRLGRILFLTVLAAGGSGCGDGTGPTGAAASSILMAAAGDYTCAVDTLQQGWCWGGGLTGQLGNGDTLTQLTPQPLSVPLYLTALSAGDFHACGLDRDAQAWCWGTNFIGVLGIGNYSGREPNPLPVAGGHRFKSISAGDSHTCGLDLSGAAWCWGQGAWGQLGLGDTLPRPLPTAVATSLRFSRLAAGGLHTCARTAEGVAWCWGANFLGQLGTGDTVGSLTPRPVGGGHHFDHLDTGNYHTCGLVRHGEAWCWGSDFASELGSGLSSQDAVVLPVPVHGGRRFVGLAVGRDHSCALTAANTIWCWGSSVYGKLGNEEVQPTTVPVQVSGGFRFTSVAAAGNHTCASTTANQIYCWGRNILGQFGNATRQGSLTPTPSLPLATP